MRRLTTSCLLLQLLLLLPNDVASTADGGSIVFRERGGRHRVKANLVNNAFKAFPMERPYRFLIILEKFSRMYSENLNAP